MSAKGRPGIGFALAVAALSLGCLHGETKSDVPIKPGQDRYNSTVQVRYLGVAGFFIRLGSDVVLTAPLYSNPSLLKEALSDIYPDAQLIQKHHFKNLNRAEDVADVRAILVGHAHYDHLMDVPYVWQFSKDAGLPGPVILGSVTMKNILAPYAAPSLQEEFPRPIPLVPAERVVALNDPSNNFLDTRNCAGFDPSPSAGAEAKCPTFQDAAGTPYRIKGASVQIQAFCARHPRQFPLIHQAPGCQVSPLAKLPKATRKDYLEGEAIAYLIDFLDGSAPPRIRFRIYYHDVPSDGPFGRIPADTLGEHPVDLALLCAGNWNMGEYADADKIVRHLKPRYVLIGHWENFFEEQRPKIGPAPFQPVALFRRLVADRMQESGGKPARQDVVLPAPQLLKTFAITR